MRPDRFPKCFAQSVQEIEDEGLFDLNLLLGALQQDGCGGSGPEAVNIQARNRNQKEAEKNEWPHVGRPL